MRLDDELGASHAHRGDAGLDRERLGLVTRDEAGDDRKHAFAQRGEKAAVVRLRVESVTVEAERAAGAERKQGVVAHGDADVTVTAGDDTVTLLQLNPRLGDDLLAAPLEVGAAPRSLDHA